MISVEKFKKKLQELDAEEIYNTYLIQGEVWYFVENYQDKWYGKYDKFKAYIAKTLNVHYNDIAIIGSAKLGFSINPSKKFKLFNEESDIDIIVISQTLYSKFWLEYLKDSYSKVKVNNYKYICKCIFRKFIIFEGFKESNQEYRSWEIKTRGFEKDLQLVFDISNDIHYRIFESWDAAKSYYISSIEKNREIITEEGCSNASN